MEFNPAHDKDLIGRNLIQAFDLLHRVHAAGIQ
jgi:hypothetical protein